MNDGTNRLQVAIGCEFAYETEHATPAVFLVRPSASGDHRLHSDRWTTTPLIGARDYVDVYGNICRRLTLPPGSSTVRYEAVVDAPDVADEADWYAVQHGTDELPDDTLLYLLPSRYCHSDFLYNKAWELFGWTAPGWTRVQAIVDFVHNHLQFGYGASNAETTALDAFRTGTGVCRDFAHLAVTFTRAMNIPARYVFGYLPDIGVPASPAPMDFAAWFEVYLGDRWWTFDARNNQRRKGRVLIARGRDALDVAMVTTFGNAQLQTMTVLADPIYQNDT